MPIYTGTTPDGSDMKEVEGMYINPQNPKEWSSKPYPKCKGRHEYENIRFKEESGIIYNKWICKCGKQL